MSVSPFSRKAALLSVLLMVCGFTLISGDFDLLYARSSGLGSGVISGPSVRMEARKIFLPLKQSGENSTSFDNSTFSAEEQGSEVSENLKSVKVENKTEIQQKVAGQSAGPASEEVSKSLKSTAQNVSRHSKSKSAVSGRKDVRKISFIKGEKSFQTKVLLSGKAEKVTWFSLKNPKRIVVDLLGSWQGRVRSLYHIKNCPVEKVIVGDHADRFRMVFYLKPGAVAAKFRPEIKKAEKSLMITFAYK